MTDQDSKQLQALKRIARELDRLRTRMRALERRRDVAIRTLRQRGVGTGDIAASCGISPGRVTQICNRQHSS